MAQTPLGEFEVLVLLAVLRLGDAAYPPAVRSVIEERSRRPASRGAVYVTLDRLDAKRLLTSRLADVSAGERGRPRRFYHVSARGLAAVRRALAGVERMSAGLAALAPER